MNAIFKIKHYLKPYFVLKPSYRFNSVSEGFNINYWIMGYSQNITNRKWAIENGIPLGLYTKDLKYEIKKRVHIAGLCEYCFANIELDDEDKNKVVLDFLEQNLSYENDDENDFQYSFWKTYTDPENEIYYVHGMGQGQMLSLFSRYYQKTKNEEYLKILIQISNSYLVNFDHRNGFVNLDEGVFFEEYPKKQKTDPKVLNGWMLALIGMHDYLKIADEKKDVNLNRKRKLFNDSIDTLVKNLKNYNLHFWSTYCQPNSILNICSIHYQMQHISFLNTLYFLTKRKEIKKFSNKLLFQFYNPIFRVLSLLSKILISNIFKYGRLYKSN